MKKLISAILITIVLSIIPGYISGDNAWYACQWFNMAIICVWMITAFLCIPNQKINERCLIASAFLFQLTEVIIYPAWLLNPGIEIFTWPIFITLMLISFYKISSRNYEYKSDPIDKDNIYLCFYKPTRHYSVFISLLGMPFGAVNIYVNNSLYGFKWGSGIYQKRFMTDRNVILHSIVVDTGIKCTKTITDSLDSLVGKKARISRLCWIRCRCIFIIIPVLKQLGRDFEPKLFEFIPALYATKVLRWRDGR